MVGNLVRNWWTFVLQGVLAIGVGIAAFTVPGADARRVHRGLRGLRNRERCLRDGRPASACRVARSGRSSRVGFSGSRSARSPSPRRPAPRLRSRCSSGSMRSPRASLGQRGLHAPAGTASAGCSPSRASSRCSRRAARRGSGTGVLAVLWLIGYYAIFAGILAIAFGLRLRGVGKDVETIKSTLTGTGSTTESTAASH